MGRKMGNPNEIQVVNIRMVKEPSLYSTEKITGPEDVKKVIAKELSTYDREVFAVLNLKTNGQPINHQPEYMQRGYAGCLSSQPKRSVQVDYPVELRCVYSHPQSSQWEYFT